MNKKIVNSWAIALLASLFLLGSCGGGGMGMGGGMGDTMGVDTSQFSHITPNLEVGISTYDSAWSSDEYQLAMHHLLPFARQGNPEAQWRVGYMFDEAEGYSEDNVRGIYWYRLAAEQNHPAGQFLYGWMHDFGEGTPLNDAEGHRWYLKAAANGHVTAMFYAAINFDTGEGTPVDDFEAVRYYRMAAETGHTGAAYNLAIMLREGEGGVPVDFVEALKWFTMVAQDDGDPDAMFYVAEMHAEGEGTRKDIDTAMSWYYRSGEGYVDQGDYGEAYRVLARMNSLDPNHSATRRLNRYIENN